MQHDSPVPVDAFAAQDNNFRAAGMRALRPALEKLTKLDYLDLFGTCGDVQRCSTQCARVGGLGRGETRTSVSGGS